MMAWVGAMAQKRYVLLEKTGYDNYRFKLDGDVPADMNKYKEDKYKEIHFVEAFNMLAERGYEVEFVISDRLFLLSKKFSGPSNAITRTKSDDGEEAYEVARYNLQGVPVSKNEKGVQIIVYSNYTTKTVIVE